MKVGFPKFINIKRRELSVSAQILIVFVDCHRNLKSVESLPSSCLGVSNLGIVNLQSIYVELCGVGDGILF